MPRRRPSQAAANRRAAKTAPRSRPKELNGCVALILIDGAPIRRKIKKAYEKAQQQLANARADLDRHLKEDAPLFDQWLNHTFGALLTALRETSRQLEDAEQLVYEVEDEYMFNGGTYASAYRRVMERRERPEPARSRQSWDETDRTHEAGDPWSRGDEDFASDASFRPTGDPLLDEILRAMHEAENAQFGNDPRSQRRFRPGKHPASSSQAPRRSSRLKELYRNLVRRLHPDTQVEMTDKKLEWWHQVQTAYQTGDEEQMEIILALCEIDETGRADATSLSLLQRITDHFKAALRDIRSRLGRHRKEPAWNFSKRLDRHVLEGQIRWEMEAELGQLRFQLEEYESLLARWKNAAHRQASRRGKSKRPTAAAFTEQFLFEEI